MTTVRKVQNLGENHPVSRILKTVGEADPRKFAEKGKQRANTSGKSLFANVTSFFGMGSTPPAAAVRTNPPRRTVSRESLNEASRSRSVTPSTPIGSLQPSPRLLPTRLTLATERAASHASPPPEDTGTPGPQDDDDRKEIVVQEKLKAAPIGSRTSDARERSPRSKTHSPSPQRSRSPSPGPRSPSTNEDASPSPKVASPQPLSRNTSVSSNVSAPETCIPSSDEALVRTALDQLVCNALADALTAEVWEKAIEEVLTSSSLAEKARSSRSSSSRSSLSSQSGSSMEVDTEVTTNTAETLPRSPPIPLTTEVEKPGVLAHPLPMPVETKPSMAANVQPMPPELKPMALQPSLPLPKDEKPILDRVPQPLPPEVKPTHTFTFQPLPREVKPVALAAVARLPAEMKPAPSSTSFPLPFEAKPLPDAPTYPLPQEAKPVSCPLALPMPLEKKPKPLEAALPTSIREKSSDIADTSAKPPLLKEDTLPKEDLPARLVTTTSLKSGDDRGHSDLRSPNSAMSSAFHSAMDLLEDVTALSDGKTSAKQDHQVPAQLSVAPSVSGKQIASTAELPVILPSSAKQLGSSIAGDDVKTGHLQETSAVSQLESFPVLQQVNQVPNYSKQQSPSGMKATEQRSRSTSGGRTSPLQNGTESFNTSTPTGVQQRSVERSSHAAVAANLEGMSRARSNSTERKLSRSASLTHAKPLPAAVARQQSASLSEHQHPDKRQSQRSDTFLVGSPHVSRRHHDSVDLTPRRSTSPPPPLNVRLSLQMVRAASGSLAGDFHSEPHSARGVSPSPSDTHLAKSQISPVLGIFPTNPSPEHGSQILMPTIEENRAVKNEHPVMDISDGALPIAGLPTIREVAFKGNGIVAPSPHVPVVLEEELDIYRDLLDGSTSPPSSEPTARPSSNGKAVLASPLANLRVVPPPVIAVPAIASASPAERLVDPAPPKTSAPETAPSQIPTKPLNTDAVATGTGAKGKRASADISDLIDMFIEDPK